MMVADADSKGPIARFPATRHSAIFAAQSADAAERERGLAILAETYWKPAYKYLRARFGEPSADAADLTQGFFTRALEKDFFAGYDAARGSFRTYLRTCLDRFVANEKKAATRVKRSPRSPILSLDFAGAEQELERGDPADGRSLEQYFHDEWMRSLFGHAVDQLKRECERRQKGIAFQLFERYELDQRPDEKVTYQHLSESFGIPSTQVTNFLAFARREFQRIVLERLRAITVSEGEFREEARSLFGVPE
jgi:DNA-directed RNA polymerase specialized sigma24 family protein